MLKLQPNPTFKADVEIPVPGEEKPAKVNFEFRHMPKDELTSFMEERQKAGDGFDGIAQGVVVGWAGVDAAFSPEVFKQFLQNYLGAGREIAAKYAGELAKARTGN